jgi:hypothetical protein
MAVEVMCPLYKAVFTAFRRFPANFGAEYAPEYAGWQGIATGLALARSHVDTSTELSLEEDGSAIVLQV